MFLIVSMSIILVLRCCFYFSFVQTINRIKGIFLRKHLKMSKKSNQTSSTISAHSRFVSVWIVIDHCKIYILPFSNKIKPSPPIPKRLSQRFLIVSGIFGKKVTVVYHYKIIACTLIFIEFYCSHFDKIIAKISKKLLIILVESLDCNHWVLTYFFGRFFPFVISFKSHYCKHNVL